MIDYISYQEIDKKLRFFKKIGSSSIEITEDEYDSLKEFFTVPNRLNKFLVGSYHKKGSLCSCDQPRNMGYLDTLLDDQCGICGKNIY